jgi:hypothetical protein
VPYICGNCKPAQTPDGSLVMSRGKRFESARRLFVSPAKRARTEIPHVCVGSFVSSRLSQSLVPCLGVPQVVAGTADDVGDSSGIDRLTEYPGFDECGTVEKASPKCREAEFCELRVDGVIGSSPRVAETGDTTFLARAYTAHPRRCDGSSSPEKEMLLLSERGRRGKRRQGARC